MIKNGRRKSDYQVLWNLGTIAPDQIPIGTVVAFAGDTAPLGWAICDGSEIKRSSSVFSVIGTKFGIGDGSLTANLPDLRGRFIRGLNGTSGRDPGAISRTASGIGGCSGNNIGSYQDDNFSSHGHTNNHSHVGAGLCICDDTHYHLLVNNNTGGANHNVQTYPDEYVKMGYLCVCWYCYLLRGTGTTPTLGPTSVVSAHTHNVSFSYTGNSGTTTENQSAPINVNINFIIKV